MTNPPITALPDAPSSNLSVEILFRPRYDLAADLFEITLNHGAISILFTPGAKFRISDYEFEVIEIMTRQMLCRGRKLPL